MGSGVFYNPTHVNLGIPEQITYEYFCVLGGLSNPKLSKRHKQNGSHVYFTYYMDRTESKI